MMTPLLRGARAALFIALCLSSLGAESISQIANIVGVRGNQLIGYGLVIGLKGTGDKGGSRFTMQSVSNMLASVNIKVAPDAIKSKNVAAVMLTATLPPFAKQGDRINVNISSIGDAKDLSGGTLILTPLSAVDGNIYALAQGNIPVLNGARLSLNIPNAATVEKEVPYNLYSQSQATLSLKVANFANALKVQKTINAIFASKIALAVDSKTIKLKKPDNLTMVEFLAQIQGINIDYSVKDRIIVDGKSGTIISGVNIKISPVIVTQGPITLQISNGRPKGSGKDKQIGNAVLSINNNTLSAKGGIDVATLVQALNKLGAVPTSIISILQALKEAGALNADIETL